MQICILGRQATALVLVLFPSDEVTETVALVRSIQKRHPSAAISILPVFVPFARGMALQLGAAHVMVFIFSIRTRLCQWTKFLFNMTIPTNQCLKDNKFFVS